MRFNLFASSAPKSNNRPIHLIWIGSALREKDIATLREWRKLNPDHPIMVWIEDKYRDTVKSQLADLHVDIQLLSTLKIPDPTKQLLNKYSEKREDGLPPNHAAASDGYRFYILDKFGGWYFDFDKTPFNVDKIKVDALYNFLMSGRITLRNGEKNGSYKP